MESGQVAVSNGSPITLHLRMTGPTYQDQLRRMRRRLAREGAFLLASMFVFGAAFGAGLRRR